MLIPQCVHTLMMRSGSIELAKLRQDQHAREIKEQLEQQALEFKKQQEQQEQARKLEIEALKKQVAELYTMLQSKYSALS